MAKQPAKNLNLSINAVAVEDDFQSIGLDITQETPDVTSFADAGPRVVVGNYGWSLNVDGTLDFASGQSDATLFAMIGSSGVAADLDPTGATAGANAPHYTGTVVLSSFSISSRVGGAITGSAKLPGNSALTRAVA